MHNTTKPKKEGKSFTITLGPAPTPGNLFPIGAQIQQAAMADKRNNRRKMKAARKQRKWDGE